MKKHFHLFKIYSIILFFFSLHSFSQDKKPILQDFQIEYARFENENKLDSINFLIQSYFEKENLNEIEKQLLYYYKGTHYIKINRHEEAIINFKKSVSLYNNFERSVLIKKLSFYFIADAYFTLKDYKKAYIFAEKAKENLNLDKYSSAYIDIYSIIGYYHFLELDYDKSLKNYAISKKAALQYNICKVSEIDLKIARILSRKNEFYKAKQTIDKAIKRNDSCNGGEINKINALKSLREILVENRKFEEAQNTFETIEKLSSNTETRKRDKKIDSLETVYKTKLKEQQNLKLKKQNFEKEKDLKTQKNIINFTILGLLILSLLLYSVIQLSKKQKKTNKELERLNLLNQKIFSVISHDFKGPITTLKLLLANNAIIANEKSIVQNYISDIKNQLEQSDIMLTSLLDWAKAELIVSEKQINTLLLKDFTDQTIKELQIKAAEKQLEFNNLIQENDIEIFNPYVLKIVLRNILINAIKFSFPENKIDISYRDNILFIKDYGKGIDEKKLNLLFAKNVNPGLGTKMETGFGIGLFLSNELMLKNNGHIAAKNNENSGSTFSIHFNK